MILTENVTELKILSETLNLDLFYPHGMDIIDEKGSAKVFIVNHSPKESIEIFQFDKNHRQILKHFEIITNEKFVCLNDITLVDENNFYVTNFVMFCKYPLLPMAEIFLNLPTSNIVHFASGKTKVVAIGESVLNGITLGKDKKKLFTVSSSTGYLLEYSRNTGNDSLHLINRHFIGFHPDNIFLDQETGVLYTSTQKNSFDMLFLAENLTNHCSVSGAKITQNSTGHTEVEEILHINGGGFVNSLSVVVHYKGQYLFGTVFDRLGYCIDRSAIFSKQRNKKI